jgi:polysaccharide export outer membrane protein
MRFLALILFAAFVLGGCGGGNRFISNRGGAVESGELDLSNIPVRPTQEEYLIGQGDALDVLFLYNSDLNQMGVKVRPDGKISLPYVGEVVAAGRSASELDSLLTVRFSEIIVKPDITVVLREFRPPVVYTLGEVANPGGYEYHTGMTLTSFLALSGSVSKAAKRNAVLVLRRIAPDHIVGIEIDLKELLDEKRFDLDIPLEAFDIVYVPKSKLGSAQDVSLAIKDILVTPMELYLKGWQVTNQKILYDYYRRTPNVF